MVRPRRLVPPAALAVAAGVQAAAAHAAGGVQRGAAQVGGRRAGRTQHAGSVVAARMGGQVGGWVRC